MRVTVYVPIEGTRASFVIDRGSGVVAIERDDDPDFGDNVLVDFEGNRYGAVNVVTYADRVWHAFDRRRQCYPTVARMLVARRELHDVGTFEDSGVVELHDVEAERIVARWLGGSVVNPSELLTSRPIRIAA